MTKEISAGILAYRNSEETLEVYLAHPGGPFFAKKDEGSWTLPKGMIDAGEDPEKAALREFKEEIGFELSGALRSIGEVKLKSGKRVIGFAVEAPAALLSHKASSNTFALEWPPRSGKIGTFPEVDRAGFFTVEEARKKIAPAQEPFIERLLEIVKGKG